MALRPPPAAPPIGVVLTIAPFPDGVEVSVSLAEGDTARVMARWVTGSGPLSGDILGEAWTLASTVFDRLVERTCGLQPALF